MIYHALNRANFRSKLFRKAAHCEDFLGIVEEGLHFVPMRILAYCLMPNHWHLGLCPRVERNAKCAGLVKRAENWPWSSAHARLGGNEKQKNCSARGPCQNRALTGSG